MDKAVLSYDLRLPRLDAVTKASVRKATTVAVWDYANKTSTKVASSYFDGVYLHVPRQYGLDYARSKGYVVEDLTVKGAPLERLQTVALHDYQKPWVNSVVSLFDKGEYDIVAKAHTGSGKTVMSLEVMRRLGRATLVLVDQNFLRDQWIDRAKEFLGLSDEQIGIVQGGKCQYEGKALVIGMVQSLYDKTYENGFYEHFGTVVYDESHTVGAEQFSKVLMMFPARYRLGISATPKRGDALQQILDFNLGPVKVTLDAKHSKSRVRYVEYAGVLSWYANISPKMGRFVNEIAADTNRNLLLAKIIVRLRKTRRNVLAISDRTEHLENLMAICHYLGMPDEDMGLVAGYKQTWGYAKDPTPARRPQWLHKGAEYTPVKLQLISKRIPKAKLVAAKDTSPVIFATYGMFAKGVDIPRLSAGVDCTPRSKAEQVHGRILRSQEGKQLPIWVTIRDTMSYKAEYQFCNRLDEYVKSNVEIEKWHLEKGIKKQEVAELRATVTESIRTLKQSKIVTALDGNNTVLMPDTESKLRSEAERATGRRSPERRRRER